MGETTPQNNAAPAPSPSSKYTALKTTALAFIAAQSHTPSLPTRMNTPLLRTLTTPFYTHTFGPAFAVSQTPKLQGVFDIDAFIGHLEGMMPLLEGWRIEIRCCVVDEWEARVVVRAGYWMGVGGGEVESEVIWELDLVEGEGGGKVAKSVEIVDPVAAGRIREIMMRGKESAVSE